MKKTIMPVVLLNLLCVYAAIAQTTEFTYQGRMLDGALPATANYDFEFRLFDMLADGSQQGSTVTKPAVPVTNGIFTVSLDFGSQFPGTDRFLEISVRNTGGGAYTLLTPRQPITSSPHSIRSLSSANADTLSAACVSCVTDTNIDSLDGSKLTGTISGNGSGLTNLNGANLTNGSVTVNQLSPDLINGPQRNLALLGSLRWDLLRSQGTFTVGTSPIGVAFDGENIWVANAGNNNVTKLRSSDGAVQGTFPVGTGPRAVAFDGANIWVANSGSNNVTKLRSSDGAVQGTFTVGAGPRAVAFDGANIWVANSGSNNVTKLRSSDGAVQGTFAVGDGPFGIVFDGANIWVTNLGSDDVTWLRASDGAVHDTFGLADGPLAGIAFDGTHIWVANQSNNNVTKLRATDGAIQDTVFAVGNGPTGVAFDGAYIWVANVSGNNVTKMRASDGVIQGRFAVGGGPFGIAFDGANIWVVNSIDNTVTRLFPSFP